MQEVFLRAWRSSARYDPAQGSLRTWLFAIARNVVVDAHRARAVRPVTAPEDAALRVGVPDGAADVVQRIELSQAVGRLSPEHRHVVTEVVCRGRTSREVAAELGASAGTVRSRLFHALRHLRTALSEEGTRHA